MIKLPKLYIEIKKNGKVVVRKRLSHSWTKNHWLQIFCTATGYTHMPAYDLAMVDTGGTSRPTTYGEGDAYDYGIPTSFQLPLNGSAGDATQGIVIGIGTADEVFTDYNLGALIAHGTGTGQMSYASMAAAGFSGNKIITWTRYFTNSSGGTIVVGEIGIISALYQGGDTWDFLLARDKLVTPISVLDTEVLQVNYTVSVSWVV